MKRPNLLKRVTVCLQKQIVWGFIALCAASFSICACGDDDDDSPQNDNNTSNNSNSNSNDNNNGNTINNSEPNGVSTQNSDPIATEVAVADFQSYLDKAAEGVVYDITIKDLTDENLETIRNVWGYYNNPAAQSGWCSNGKYDKLSFSITIKQNEKLTKIGGFCFEFCPATSISIPEGIKKIGTTAFAECPNLTKIVLPTTVTDIDNFAFSYVMKLQEITFQSKAKVGHELFSDIKKLKIIVPVEHLEYYQGCYFAEELEDETITAAK